MENLFTSMLLSLGKAADKLNLSLPVITAGKEDDVADAVNNLNDLLRQLDGFLSLGYSDDTGLPAALIQYVAQLQEYEQGCSEKIEYLLDSYTMFGDNTNYEQYKKQFLEELLRDIQANAEVIATGVTSY